MISHIVLVHLGPQPDCAARHAVSRWSHNLTLALKHRCVAGCPTIMLFFNHCSEFQNLTLTTTKVNTLLILVYIAEQSPDLRTLCPSLSFALVSLRSLALRCSSSSGCSASSHCLSFVVGSPNGGRFFLLRQGGRILPAFPRIDRTWGHREHFLRLLGLPLHRDVEGSSSCCWSSRI